MALIIGKIFRLTLSDTTLLLGHLETLGLDLSDCRGQSYDKGSNKQGKRQVIQARVLELIKHCVFHAAVNP